jgi:hypothetical protein
MEELTHLHTYAVLLPRPSCKLLTHPPAWYLLDIGDGNGMEQYHATPPVLYLYGVCACVILLGETAASPCGKKGHFVCLFVCLSASSFSGLSCKMRPVWAASGILFLYPSLEDALFCFCEPVQES